MIIVKKININWSMLNSKPEDIAEEKVFKIRIILWITFGIIGLSILTYLSLNGNLELHTSQNYMVMYCAILIALFSTNKFSSLLFYPLKKRFAKIHFNKIEQEYRENYWEIQKELDELKNEKTNDYYIKSFNIERINLIKRLSATFDEGLGYNT